MELTEVVSLLGVGIIAAALAVVLRQYHPEFAMMVSLAAGIYLLLRVVGAADPILREIQSVLSSASLPAEQAGILPRALGLCFLTQIASDACKDAGETAISAKVELAGKLAVLAVSLPLFRQVLAVVGELIN